MRENKSSGKNSCPELLLMEKKLLFHSACLGAFYSQTPFTNYQNNVANTITMGEKKEENQKGTKWSKLQKAGKVNSAGG